jgi:formate-dependent nitrite reductase membrane component NrfD
MLKRILFVVAALVLLAASFYVRSRNAATAQAQADQIEAQDTAGSDTTAAFTNLQAYARSHLGVDVNLTLNGSYARAQTAAKAAATASAVNSQIYADAQRACGGKTDSITQARCNQDYLDKHLTNVPQPTPVAEPKLADYQHSIRSPVWAPDIAGALLLGGLAALVLAIVVNTRRRRRG